MRKLLIIPWFGPLPDWMHLYRENIRPLAEHGFDFLFDHDLAAFKKRVEGRLGIDCPITEGSGKIHDYRVAFGQLYEQEIMPYDFWGHTDLDCVYGRVWEFFTDERLADCDILTDGYRYLNGPWTLYRRGSGAESLFQQVPTWQQVLTDHRTYGWAETEVAKIAFRNLRVDYGMAHAWNDPDLLWWDGHRLRHRSDEIPFFHFRYLKQWPASLDGTP